MITTPRRAVTRFFIPLIDVLILLFCIFLLMPFVSGPAAPDPADQKASKEPPLPATEAELRRELIEARDRIKRMEAAAQIGFADRVIVRVLFVGKDTNGIYLYHYDDAGRREIRNGTHALQYVTQQAARAAQAGGVKELKYAILYPRDESGFARGYPNAKEEATIRGWFGDVRVEFQ